MHKLRDEVTGTTRITYTRRPALYASACSACSKLFQMDGPRGMTAADLEGVFDCCAEDGRGLGNIFSATACSFECAGALFNGAWHTMAQYQPWVKAGARIEQATITITAHMKTETDLIAEWEAAEERLAPMAESPIYISGGWHT